MPKRTLNEKREQMTRFLFENIHTKVTRGKRIIEVVGNDIAFTDRDGVEYFIKTLSKQSDFPYNFETNPRFFDNDGRKLDNLCEVVSSFIQEKNKEGFIPGFVFLRAETNYPKNGDGKITNHGYFLKQELRSNTNPSPTFDNKRIDHLEVIIRLFYKYNDCNINEKLKIKNNDNIYFPELIYFNSKKNISKAGTVEVIWFSHKANPSLYILENCPICENPNGDEYDHRPCKTSRKTKYQYIEYTKKRSEARYSKFIFRKKEKVPIKSRSKSRKKKGVRFQPVKLVSDTKLYLPHNKVLYIARVK